MDAVPNVLKASWPAPQEHDKTGKRGKNNTFSDGHYYPHDLATVSEQLGKTQYGCLARTESFVVRLTTLSCWLMGYSPRYLALWEAARTVRSSARSAIPSSRKSQSKSSKP
jgi:hypothetical protein